MAKFQGMATKAARTRRARGSLDAHTRRSLFAEIDKDAKATFDEIADATGVSLALVLEELAKHARSELDDNGVPEWWPSSATQQDGFELVIANRREAAPRKSA
ncbi:hypothetical protein L603_005500000080 [Cellulosimicrobium cellulans J34]|nr:hypothetical protein L603_005500000080 [Cellulosimicrobium cellulans J34]SMF47178.1 hypothetical protein SAMN02744115_03489 [Cellulosimicrobium cellulans J1]